MTAFERAWKNGDIIEVAGYPLPKPAGIRPLHALKSAYRLRDNKEDTSQVYEVTRALSGSQYVDKFRRFAGTDYGKKVISGEVRVNALLNDWDRLAAMPAGSVGRHYHDFMREEDLDPDALRQASEQAGLSYTDETYFPEYCRQLNHFQVTHDLWHILSGYGRDALGELCLLNFYRGQWAERGLALIVWVGGRTIKKLDPSIPVDRAFKEAISNGKKADWIMSFDPESYLHRPVEEVRDMMNIAGPVIYKSIDLDSRPELMSPESMMQAA